MSMTPTNVRLYGDEGASNLYPAKVSSTGHLYVTSGGGALEITDGGSSVTIDTNSGAIDVQGDIDILSLPSLPAGTNNIGDVDVLSLPSLPTGSNTIGRILFDGQSVDGQPYISPPDGVIILGGDGSNIQLIKTGADGSISVNDNSSSLTIDGSVGITDGATSIALKTYGSDSLTSAESVPVAAFQDASGRAAAPILDGSGNVNVAVTKSLPAGTANIGDVDILSVVPGTGATNLGKGEDLLHVGGDTGVMALGIREDALDADCAVNLDHDYTPLRVNNKGALWVAQEHEAFSETFLTTGDGTTKDHTKFPKRIFTIVCYKSADVTTYTVLLQGTWDTGTNWETLLTFTQADDGILQTASTHICPMFRLVCTVWTEGTPGGGDSVKCYMIARSW